MPDIKLQKTPKIFSYRAFWVVFFAVLIAWLSFIDSAKAEQAQQTHSGPEVRASQPILGRYSQKSLPRFASLKADRVNLRYGPGTDYAILWELRRRGLPVRIISEYGHWRRVILHDGVRGWIHQALLSNKRMAIIMHDQGKLHATPSEESALKAHIAPHTPLRLYRCTLDWCQAERNGITGWVVKQSLWGVDPQEAF